MADPLLALTVGLLAAAFGLWAVIFVVICLTDARAEQRWARRAAELAPARSGGGTSAWFGFGRKPVPALPTPR